jgi:hypothetical protein
MRAQPFFTPMHRGQLPAVSCRHLRADGPERMSGRNAVCGITPSTIMSPAWRHYRHSGSWTEIRPGARAHHTRTSDRAHAPPATNDFKHVNPDAALAGASLHR